MEDIPEPPTEPTAPLDLVDVDTVADMAGIRPAAVHHHLAKGTIPAPDTRTGNTYAWRRETIEEWIRARRQPGRRGTRR